MKLTSLLVIGFVVPKSFVSGVISRFFVACLYYPCNFRVSKEAKKYYNNNKSY